LLYWYWYKGHKSTNADAAGARQLGGNDFKDPPIEIVKEGIGAILEYLDKFFTATRTNVLDLRYSVYLPYSFKYSVY
jgi:hypothetical protein